MMWMSAKAHNLLSAAMMKMIDHSRYQLLGLAVGCGALTTADVLGATVLGLLFAGVGILALYFTFTATAISAFVYGVEKKKGRVE